MSLAVPPPVRRGPGRTYISFRVKVTAALCIGLAMLVTLAVIGFRSIDESYQAGLEVRRMLWVEERLEAIRLDLFRAETAQLRQQLAGTPPDLAELQAITDRVRGAIKELSTVLIVPDQKDRLNGLERAVSARLDFLAGSMRSRGRGPQPAESFLSGQGAEPGAGIAGISDAISGRERQLMKGEGERAESNALLASRIMYWTAALAVVLLLWVILIINRYERDRRRTEADLRGARQRLALALEGSNSAVWDWDVQRDEIYLSESWKTMLGAQASETTVKPAQLLELVHADDLEQVYQSVTEALEGTKSEYRAEHRVRRLDGSWMWILSRGRVVRRNDSGRALRVTGINQDVTDKKRMELALAEHDQRLMLALETAAMVNWDWEVPSDQMMWLDSPERLAGPRPHGGYLCLQDMVHPEDLVRFIRTLNDSARSGEPYRDEFRITRTDGQVVWVLARGRHERDSSGKVTRVIGVAQDISELKEKEQALRASERELRLITDSVPALISCVDANEQIVFCNNALAGLMGVPPAALIGRTLSEVFEGETYRIIQPYAKRALAGEKVRFQRSQTTRDRGSVDLDVTFVPRRTGLGEPGGFYSLSTDITEFKRLDRMKSEFVSTVSHELRTPLTSIRGSLGLLAGGVAGTLPEKARSFIDIAKNNCERLIRLINDILDIEKLESGKMNFQLRVLDLMEFLKQVLGANEGFASQNGVTLQVVSAKPGSKVNVDSDRLAQVLTNLISNACKFSPQGGTVDIAVTGDGGRVRVSVVDHGPGISDDFRKRIFQKFSQADSSDMRQKGGTGLGLSISKAIIEGLGGEIGFETQSGKGATFYFVLPEWHEAAGPSAAAPTGRPRVLVCEDDADVARLLQIIFDQAGYDSDVAGSAMQAKVLLREGNYAAMTLDLRLPDQDGLSLVRELRAHKGLAHIPVIVVSAAAQEGKLKLAGEPLGIVDWLAKPIDQERLLAVLRSTVTDNRRLRILHVEDDADVRKVVALLARDFADFSVAESLAQARERLQRESFDLVLLDLGLPDGSGWELVPLVSELPCRPPVVIFSAHDAAKTGEHLASLASGFLVKSQTSDEQLIQTIKRAVKGTA